jgi:hypothetical protein
VVCEWRASLSPSRLRDQCLGSRALLDHGRLAVELIAQRIGDQTDRIHSVRHRAKQLLGTKRYRAQSMDFPQQRLYVRVAAVQLADRVEPLASE